MWQLRAALHLDLEFDLFQVLRLLAGRQVGHRQPLDDGLARQLLCSVHVGDSAHNAKAAAAQLLPKGEAVIERPRQPD